MKNAKIFIVPFLIFFLCVGLIFSTGCLGGKEATKETIPIKEVKYNPVKEKK